MAYAEKRRFTVDHTKVGGASGTLTDYPVLISGTFIGSGLDPDLRSVGNGGDIQNVDATATITGANNAPADMQFFDDTAGTTEYPYECVKYDPATGEFIAWVKIPTLNKASATEFYMHYSDSGVTTSQESIDTTWETNFKAMWHMEQASSTRHDSSGNSNNLTANNNPGSATGQVGDALQLDPDVADESLSITNASQTGLDQTTNSFSIGAWLNSDEIDATRYVIGNLITTGWRFTTSPSGADPRLRVNLDDGTDTTYVSGTLTPGNNEWFLAVATINRTSDELQFYVNGSPFGSPIDISATTGSITSSDDIYVGANVGNPAAEGNIWDGEIDELFVYSDTLSADWIETFYNNTNSPSTFYTITDPSVTTTSTSTTSTSSSTSSSSSSSTSTTSTSSSTSTSTTSTSSSTSTTSTSSSTSTTSTSSSTSSSSSSSTSTTTLPATCVSDQSYTAAKNTNHAFGTNAQPQVGQQFTPSATAKICNVNVTMAKAGSPTDNMKLEIWSLSGGLPDSLLAEADDQASGSGIPALFGEEVFSFNFTDGPVLTASTQYAFVLSRTSSLDDSNYYAPYAGSTSLYGGGSALTYNGTIWSENSSIDVWFQEYYDNTSATTTSTSTTSTSSSTSTTSTSSSTSSSTSTSTTSTSSSTSSSTSTTSTSSSTTQSTTTSTSTTSTSTSTTSTSSSTTNSSTTSTSSTTTISRMFTVDVAF